MKKSLMKVLGVILIILGFLALITPLTPGSWLLLIGLEILGLRFLLKGKLSYFLKLRPMSALKSLIRKVREIL